MENKPVRDIIRPYCHLPSGNYGFCSPQGLAHRPSNDISMDQFHDHCQVHPSITGPYIGHVGYPFLVFPIHRKVTVQLSTIKTRGIRKIGALKKHVLIFGLS